MKNTDTLKPQTENIVSDGVAEAATVPAAAGVGYVRTDAAPFVSGEAAKKPPRTIEISKKAVVTAVAIVLVLVIFAIVLTQVLPRGAYDRIPDANGNEQIVPDSYREDPSLDTLKWWQAVFAPVPLLRLPVRLPGACSACLSLPHGSCALPKRRALRSCPGFPPYLPPL